CDDPASDGAGSREAYVSVRRARLSADGGSWADCEGDIGLMRMAHFLVTWALLLLILAVSRAEEPRAAASEWRSLFAGKDLSNWPTVGNAQWRVEKGIIVGGQDGDPKKSGLLMTKDQFTDFEIELEFMIDEHGKYNSGVYLRQEPGKGGRSGYQVNIGRGQAQEYTAGIFTDHWLAKGDEHDKIRKPLDWNSLRIRAEGGHIVVHLNGVKVSDYDDPNPAERFLKPGAIAL